MGDLRLRLRNLLPAFVVMTRLRLLPQSNIRLNIKVHRLSPDRVASL